MLGGLRSAETGALVTLNHLGWPVSGLSEPGSDWSETFDYFANAWVSVMDLFGDFFEREQ